MFEDVALGIIDWIGRSLPWLDHSTGVHEGDVTSEEIQVGTYKNEDKPEKWYRPSLVLVSHSMAIHTGRFPMVYELVELPNPTSPIGE